jgi:ABC-2 type transport system ATP-binding protein
VIVIEHLCRRFGETLAVADLSLEIQPGEVFGLLGHNGAGKTTTIRLINGVLIPNGGTVRVFGLSPFENGENVRQRTGVLTETPALYEPLTARENLTAFAHLYNVLPGDVARRVDEILAAFDLADRADEKVGGYSKGMKQRLALARTLLHQPDILFLDEPTAGLDPVAARAVHDLILRLSREQGRTIVLCTHNLVEAQKLCQRVAVMEHGHLVALGTPAELTHRYATTLRLDIEIATEDRVRALEVVTAQGATSRELAEANGGETVLALSGVAREAIPALLEALITAGVRVYRVAPYEPTLEDVYFALHDTAKEPAL